MKMTLEIAKVELKKLFFSPVSWLILIIFSFQVTLEFNRCMDTLLRLKGYGHPFSNLTHAFFASDINFAFFTGLQGSLYLYIPLLTMNALSKDISSGAIKLLYSSPVTNAQIVLGKYLSLVIFGAIMMLIVVVEGVYAGWHIENADWSLVFNGLAGLFLLICCYAAVGVLMSSLTSYAIVAAITTFAVLAFFSIISYLGQEVPLVRDITWWFAIGNRAQVLINGLVSTESLLYFIAFTAFFLSLAIIKMHAGRSRQPRLVVLGKYLLVVLVVATIGYISSLPTMKLYWDVTSTKLNTLTDAGQEIMKQLEGGLTIRTYTNMLEFRTSQVALPARYKADVARYDLFTRFKPDTKFDYIYYYKSVPEQWYNAKYPGLTDNQLIDTLKRKNHLNFDIFPYNQMPHALDLSGEDYTFVTVLERDNGKRAFLRIGEGNQYPDEAHITAAMKSLVQPMPLVGVVKGHGERSIDAIDERGYQRTTQHKRSLSALINHGFSFTNLTLTTPVPDSVTILLISDIKAPLNDKEMQYFREYLGRGGNLFIAAEPGKQPTMNPLLSTIGVRMLEGMLIQPKEILSPETILSHATPAADSCTYLWRELSRNRNNVVTMKTAAALTCDQDTGFKVVELLTTDSTTAWNEKETTQDAGDSAVFNPAAGEVKQPYVTAISLSRMVNNKEQQIIVTGDADWLSNGGIYSPGLLSVNGPVFYGIYNILSGGEAPIEIRRAPPTDNKVLLDKKSWKPIGMTLKWGLPGALLIFSTLMLIRRKGR